MTNLPHSPDGTPCVLYGAKSTEDVHASIPTQMEEGREMAAENSWTIVAEFTDEGFSAYSGNRGPGLDDAQQAAAEAAAAHGRPCMLLAQAHDRFARGAGDAPGAARHLVEVWIDARRSNVHLHTVEDDFDMRDVASVAAIGQRAMQDSRRKSKSVRKGITRRADGGTPWGQPAYAFRKQADGRWEPNPAEVPTYQRIYRERVENGRSYTGIAKLFNAEGVPTRGGSSRWSEGLVRKILTGRYGLGEFKHGDKWIKGSHPALLDEEQWDAAQALAALGSRYGPSRGGRRPALHLFTNGLLRCGECGEAMLPRGAARGDNYQCRTNVQLRGAGACAMPAHKREAVDRAGVEIFLRSFLDFDATRDHVAADLDGRLRDVEARAAAAATEVVVKRAQLIRVERDYLKEDLSAATFERLAGTLADDLRAIEAQHDRLTAHAADIRGSQGRLDAEAVTIERLNALSEAVRARVRTAEQGQDVIALRGTLAQTFAVLRLSTSGEFLDFGPQDSVDEDDPDAYDEIAPRPIPLTPRTDQHGTLVS